MSSLTWITDKELKREIKYKEARVSLEEKRENVMVIVAVRS